MSESNSRHSEVFHKNVLLKETAILKLFEKTRSVHFFPLSFVKFLNVLYQRISAFVKLMFHDHTLL